MSEHHDISVESDFTDPGWWATCSCGWIGETWEDFDDALIDGRDHHHTEDSE